MKASYYRRMMRFPGYRSHRASSSLMLRLLLLQGYVSLFPTNLFFKSTKTSQCHYAFCKQNMLIPIHTYVAGIKTGHMRRWNVTLSKKRLYNEGSGKQLSLFSRMPRSRDESNLRLFTSTFIENHDHVQNAFFQINSDVSFLGLVGGHILVVSLVTCGISIIYRTSREPPTQKRTFFNY